MGFGISSHASMDQKCVALLMMLKIDKVSLGAKEYFKVVIYKG